MQDKILKIAESMGFEQYRSENGNLRFREPFSDTDSEFVNFFKTIGFTFNPYENDGDAFKVLNHVLGNTSEINNYRQGAMFICRILTYDGIYYFGDGDSANKAICEAYLSLIN